MSGSLDGGLSTTDPFLILLAFPPGLIGVIVGVVADRVAPPDSAAPLVGRVPIQRHPLAVDTEGLLRRRSEGQGRSRDLAPGVADRFARFAGQQLGKLVCILRDALRDVRQRVPAFVAREVSSLGEPLDRGHDRALELGWAGLERGRHQLVRRRIAHLERRTRLHELAGKVDRNGGGANLGGHGRIVGRHFLGATVVVELAAIIIRVVMGGRDVQTGCGVQIANGERQFRGGDVSSRSLGQHVDPHAISHVHSRRHLGKGA